jgi:peroxiredoxin/predicted 2-oxoglutarate/Fe(II)-dependent dioxygenase YbiX
MATLKQGDFAPMFITPSSVNPAFRMDSTGGRRVVLFFLASTRAPGALTALTSLVQKQAFFEQRRSLVFVVSADAADQSRGDLPQRAAPYVVFWDLQLAIMRQYGLVQSQSGDDSTIFLGSMVLDENSRIIAFVPLRSPDRHAEEVAAAITSIPPLPSARRVTHQPPVLLVPDIVPAEYCRRLIEAYEAHGGEEGSSLVDIGGETVHVLDQYHKRRKDWLVPDQTLLAPLHSAIHTRLAPEVRKAFHFAVTGLERDLIGCYDGSTGGHFRPHRDDTTVGTAHRRYALTINLNAEEYEGGDLRFPEYSMDTYRPPTGGAIVFSCTLMHEVLPVTSGRRYAFVSFLLDPETTAMLSSFIGQQSAEGKASQFLVE